MTGRRRVLVSAALLSMIFCGVTPLAAQTRVAADDPGDTLVSPQVLQDKRVVFRVYAPKATAVTISGDWIDDGHRGASRTLAKDYRGVWSVTAGPLAADFYSYTFTVDGVRTLDPENAWIKQGQSSLSNVFQVPGPATAFQDNRRVPHGRVSKVWYYSDVAGRQRRMHVYTPPGYGTDTASYPVLYLLHGGGDEDSGWSTIGRANFKDRVQRRAGCAAMNRTFQRANCPCDG